MITEKALQSDVDVSVLQIGEEERKKLNTFLANSYTRQNISAYTPMLRTETGIITPVSSEACKTYLVSPPDNNSIVKDFWINLSPR